MNFTPSTLIAASVLLAACTAASEPGLDERFGPNVDEIVAPDSARCAELDERARQLIEQSMACEHDMHCEAVSTIELLGGTCAPAFTCYLPVSRAMAHPEFVAAARDIDEAYASACGCPVASCVDPNYVLALCEGSCTIDVDIPDPLEVTY